MEVSKELRADIESNQGKLKIAIRNHQMLVIKLKADPDNVIVKYDIKAAQNDIISIGLDQKELIERLRKELKVHKKKINASTTKTGVNERKYNLSNILGKVRKQTLTVRSTSISSPSASPSEDSLDVPSAPPSPTPPLLPHELTQVDFLGRMGLCTHDVFKELQNKRVERKRRSTANPHFLYGNRWDYSTKRKKNSYLASSSPPTTRQSAKNKQKAEQRVPSPPSRTDSRSCSPVSKKAVTIGLNIPNLPSGLTIERINGNRNTPDSKLCVVCRTAGGLSVCESCSGGFHVCCHNRPLVVAPRQCPKCLEKTLEKKALLEKNKNLNAELNQLENRAEELTVSLKNQETTKEKLVSAQRVTKQNIQRLLDFVNTMKGLPHQPPPCKSPVSVIDGS